MRERGVRERERERERHTHIHVHCAHFLTSYFTRLIRGRDRETRERGVRERARERETHTHTRNTVLISLLPIPHNSTSLPQCTSERERGERHAYTYTVLISLLPVSHVQFGERESETRERGVRERERATHTHTRHTYTHTHTHCTHFLTSYFTHPMYFLQRTSDSLTSSVGTQSDWILCLAGTSLTSGWRQTARCSSMRRHKSSGCITMTPPAPRRSRVSCRTLMARWLCTTRSSSCLTWVLRSAQA
jgi:hypothetical protein